jgi:ribosome-associated protein
VPAVTEWLEVTPDCAVDVSEIAVRFSPSGGPGGQHANKASTRVELRFDIAGSSSLTEGQRARLLERVGDELRVVADAERSQLRNRGLAMERLRQRLAAGLREERRRRPTRPSRAARARRLDAKRRQGERKRDRRRPGTGE